jgi:hypothetical protein
MELATLTKQTRIKHQKKQPPEFVEGHQAQENFEKTMKTLFRSPKIDLKKIKKGKD